METFNKNSIFGQNYCAIRKDVTKIVEILPIMYNKMHLKIFLFDYYDN